MLKLGFFSRKVFTFPVKMLINTKGCSTSVYRHQLSNERYTRIFIFIQCYSAVGSHGIHASFANENSHWTKLPDVCMVNGIADCFCCTTLLFLSLLLFYAKVKSSWSLRWKHFVASVVNVLSSLSLSPCVCST